MKEHTCTAKKSIVSDGPRPLTVPVEPRLSICVPNTTAQIKQGIQLKILNDKNTPSRWQAAKCLTTETVEGAALALESVDDVQRGDSLALGVLGVRDGITDDALKEGLENGTGLLVDHCDDLLTAWSVV